MCVSPVYSDSYTNNTNTSQGNKWCNNYNEKRYTSRSLSTVYCANCGGQGHIYKTCNHPVTSYGVICYKLCYNKEDNTIYPKYLLVQRKDSLSFVEFLRGKYDVNNVSYLLKLFSHMTEDERTRIRTMNYEELWKDMWRKNHFQEHNRAFNRELNESKAKFDILKKGVYIKNTSTSELTFVDMNYILDNSKSEFNETEWGFPKGRRNINEDDMTCALREFKEETGIGMRFIRVCTEMKPFEEVFSGTNKVRYRHIYYVAKYQNNIFDEFTYNDPPKITHMNSMEIRDIKWFTYNEAQSKIREMNVERRELFKRLNHIVLRSIHNNL